MEYINDFTLAKILGKCHTSEQEDINLNTKIGDLKETISKRKDGNLDFILKNVIVTISNIYLNEIINQIKSDKIMVIHGEIGECRMFDNGKLLMPKPQVFKIAKFTDEDLVVDVIKNTCLEVMDWIFKQFDNDSHKITVLIDKSNSVCLQDGRFYKTLSIMQF